MIVTKIALVARWHGGVVRNECREFDDFPSSMRHCKSHYPQHARQLAERDYHSECCVEPVGTEFITGDSIGFVGENPAERAKETKLFWKFFDCNVYSSFNRENPHVIEFSDDHTEEKMQDRLLETCDQDLC